MQRNQTKRKLHDIWALALYIITTITCYGLVITFKDKVNRDISMEGFNTNLLKALLVNLAAVISTFIAFTTIPAVFIHASFFFSIGFSVFLAVKYQFTGTIVFAVLNTIFTLIFYFFCYKYIKFTGILLKEATLIMYQYLLGFIGFFLVSLSIFGLQIYVTFPLILKTEDKQTYLFILFVFYYFWTVFNGFYFFIVFSASVISIHLYNKGTKKDTFIPGVKNSLFCAGSVCLGGMLIALINTLRFMVDKNESDRRRRGETRGLVGIILMVILYVIIYLLEDIIAFANEWTFVYMAIYGKNYINSLKESFNKISNPTNKLLVSNLIVDRVTGMFTICFLMLYMYAIGIFDLLTGKVTILIDTVISFTFAFVFCLYFLVWFYSLFGSACKTILFVNDEDKQCIREVMPKVSEEFEKIEHK